jgi:AcrR family transcriptional regulator
MERQSTDIRQEQIKQAVIDIISTDGLKNLSIRNLAKRIGMSEGSIFRHFNSKKDIILSIFNDIQENFVGALRKIAWSVDEPPIRLFKYLSTTIKYHTDNKGANMLLFSEASYNNDLELKNRLQQIFHDQKDLVSKIVLDGVNAGIWDKNIRIENVALIYLGIPVAMNMEMLLGGKNFQFDDFSNQMTQLILKILQKQ